MLPGYSRERVAEYVIQTAGAVGDFLLVDGSNEMEADLDCDGNKVVNLSVTTNPADGATKSYVDSAAVTPQAVGTAFGLKAITRIFLNGMTTDGGTVTRFDGGTPLTVVSSGTPSATQIGVSNVGAGTISVEDGSGELLNTATNLLIDNTFRVCVGGETCQPPQFTTQSTHEMYLVFANSGGSAYNLSARGLIEIWHYTNSA